MAAGRRPADNPPVAAQTLTPAMIETYKVLSLLILLVPSNRAAFVELLREDKTSYAQAMADYLDSIPPTSAGAEVLFGSSAHAESPEMANSIFNHHWDRLCQVLFAYDFPERPELIKRVFREQAFTDLSQLPSSAQLRAQAEAMVSPELRERLPGFERRPPNWPGDINVAAATLIMAYGEYFEHFLHLLQDVGTDDGLAKIMAATLAKPGSKPGFELVMHLNPHGPLPLSDPPNATTAVQLRMAAALDDLGVTSSPELMERIFGAGFDHAAHIPLVSETIRVTAGLAAQEEARRRMEKVRAAAAAPPAAAATAPAPAESATTSAGSAGYRWSRGQQGPVTATENVYVSERAARAESDLKARAAEAAESDSDSGAESYEYRSPIGDLSLPPPPPFFAMRGGPGGLSPAAEAPRAAATGGRPMTSKKDKDGKKKD